MIKNIFLALGLAAIILLHLYYDGRLKEQNAVVDELLNANTELYKMYDNCMNGEKE